MFQIPITIGCLSCYERLTLNKKREKRIYIKTINERKIWMEMCLFVGYFQLSFNGIIRFNQTALERINEQAEKWRKIIWLIWLFHFAFVFASVFSSFISAFVISIFIWFLEFVCSFRIIFHSRFAKTCCCQTWMSMMLLFLKIWARTQFPLRVNSMDFHCQKSNIILNANICMWFSLLLSERFFWFIFRFFSQFQWRHYFCHFKSRIHLIERQLNERKKPNRDQMESINVIKIMKILKINTILRNSIFNQFWICAARVDFLFVVAIRTIVIQLFRN